MAKCSACPRKCGATRPKGFCGMPEKAVIARAERHMFEEPCICGEGGSGTVFFCGCNLRCVFCQNRKISRKVVEDTLETDADGLAEIMLALQNSGCCNINLVTPSHYPEIIRRALDKACLSVPVVWNSGGYDSNEELETVADRVDIFMPDFKYASDDLGKKYSGAPDYFTVCSKALKKMTGYVPTLRFGSDGLMKKGLIIRHLVLPGNAQNSIDVIDYLYDSIPRDSFMFSLMGQFTPPGDEEFKLSYPELSGPLSAEEYETVLNHFKKRKFNGYIQYPGENEAKYIPEFGKKHIITKVND